MPPLEKYVCVNPSGSPATTKTGLHDRVEGFEPLSIAEQAPVLILRVLSAN